MTATTHTPSLTSFDQEQARLMCELARLSMVTGVVLVDGR